MAVTSKKVSRATSEDLKIGEMVEKQEHKWASPQVAKKIAADHLRKDPSYYTGNCGGGTEKATVNIKIRQVRPQKKVPPPPPSNAPDWIQPNYRLWG